MNSNSTLSNMSSAASPDSASPTPTWMIVFAYCLAGSISVVGGIGNSTIILLTALNKQLRTKQHIYFFALTVSDLIVTAFVAPQGLETYVVGRWRHSRVWCRMYWVILALAFCSSLNFVALIARDRMLIVTKGAAYDVYESARRKWLYVAINVVLLPILLLPYTSLDIFTGFSLNQEEATGNGCESEQLQNLYVTIVNQFIFTMPPFAFMLYYYTCVRRYLLYKRQRLQQQQQQHTSVNKLNRQRRNQTAPQAATTSTQATPNVSTAPQPATTQATEMSALTTVAVGISVEKSQRAVKIMNLLLLTAFTVSLPVTFTSIVVNLLMASPTLVEPRTFAWWKDLYGLSFFMCYIAHAIDPILYAYALPSYREALKKLLRCAH